MKNNKLTPEERAVEIKNRFYNINDIKMARDDGTNSYISRRMSILCALELVKENLYFLTHIHQQNDNRRSYWRKVEQILEQELNDT